MSSRGRMRSMARTPDGPLVRRHVVRARIDDIEKRIVDRRRGKLSESEYLRRLIREDGRPRKEAPRAEA